MLSTGTGNLWDRRRRHICSEQQQQKSINERKKNASAKLQLKKIYHRLICVTTI